VSWRVDIARDARKELARLPGLMQTRHGQGDSRTGGRPVSEGEQGKRLVAWLNALPEVRAIIATEFGGKPIREQSLSEWRKGGYRDWLAPKGGCHR
jgi:hypothetical protein